MIRKQSGKKISAHALLDSGAEGMIINHAFATNHALTLRTLRSPLSIRNVNGSTNTAGPIHHTTIQTIRIQTHDKDYHQERAGFYVTNVGTHDIILGMDWLKAHNPELDWTNSIIVLPLPRHLCSDGTTSVPVPLDITIPHSLHQLH